MEEYEQTLVRVTNEICDYALEEIRMNFSHGTIWLGGENGGIQFANRYRSVFKKYFGEKITPIIEDQIFVAGRSLEYLVFALYDRNTDFDSMAYIVTAFLSSQINNMEDWSDLWNSFVVAETD
jgi:hypothetical protein